MKEKKKLNQNTFLLLVTILLFFVMYAIGCVLFNAQGFAKTQNFLNLFISNAGLIVIGIGMTIVMITGGIDISVGSFVAMGCMMLAWMMEKGGIGAVPAVIIVLVTGIVFGLVQGFLVAYMDIQPFIVTLAGMLAFRGLSNVVLQGMTVSIKDCTTFVNLFGGGADCYIPDFFGNGPINLTCVFAGVLAVVIFAVLQLKNRADKVKKGYEAPGLGATIGKIAVIAVVILAFSYRLAQHKGIPSVLIWVLIVIMVYGYITSNTTVGRYFYAVGGNEKATKLSGINTNKVYFLAYMNMGFLAALAGMVTIARMTSAQPTYGQNYEMDAIGSCFIGGASAYGGTGTVPGVIVGAVLMGVINLGMSLMGVDQNMQKVVKGLVLLAAVIFDVVSKRGGKLIAKN